MLKYLFDGGIFMWVILLASISGLAVIIEKMYTFLSKEKKLSENEKNQLYKALRTGNKEEILKLCKDKTDSVSKSVTKIVSNMDINFDQLDNSHRQVIEGIISESILEQTTELEKGMSLLGTVVNAAPQLGLLGTVTGMIAAFSALTRNGTSTAKIVAGGISEALYTTAFGLIVAIPALVFYNYFNRRIDVIVAEMERAALQFLSRVKDWFLQPFYSNFRIKIQVNFIWFRLV